MKRFKKFFAISDLGSAKQNNLWYIMGCWLENKNCAGAQTVSLV
jgi:hypothetical protein